ncbi:xylulokinase [Cytobacillus massiliigabonensis]|uniref:xylulokinase n=1 Tax=Cytobacillus massiliigabonensis TaxID=1871011 RepID=UPI0015E0A326|nr:FGGY-family carbohydrate kinase [Cytobacillus massiliigabonensis]
MSAFLLAHDLGTTNHKCVVFNEKGDIIASAQRAYPTYYSNGGMAEQDPNDWWSNFLETTKEVLTIISPGKIAGISFSAHMNGCLPVDQNGVPLMRSIIHADTRSMEIETEVYQKVCENQLYNITGNRIDSRYTLLKMYWLKEKKPEIYQYTRFFLQAKDYLVYKLTGNLGVTDYSDASLTGAFHLKNRQWEDSLFKELGLDLSKMPIPVPSTEIVGYVQKEIAKETGLLAGTPVIIGGGDGACATAGAGSLRQGETYISLGTTAWVSKVVEEPFIDIEKRVFSICDLNPKYYNVLGTMQTAGAAYEWAIKLFSPVVEWGSLEVKPEYQQFDKQIKKVPAGARGLIFHPYLLGERSPIWNEKARGSFLGMHLEHNRFDMAKAVLEGIAYSLCGISEIINPQARKEIRMIGGLVQSESLIQTICDVLERPIQLTANPSEATSLGAAIALGVGIQMFPSFEDASHMISKVKQYHPNDENSTIYNHQMNHFKILYERIKDIQFNN